jgi:hypothetical protein
MVKFGKGTTPDEREKLIALIREFKDVFSWSYEYLKAYQKMLYNTLFLLKKAQNPSGRNSDK